MTLYQKYRSKTFKDILTQSHITKILQSSLKQENYGHAYLFVGTRGVGKTSLARIFARALNCENKEIVKKIGEPCNECESCKLSILGNHPDIIEMDAASNRGIDEIRNLKESIEFMPSMGSKKVYIIDEVHMMTKEAFNALLKTLEEPPQHVVFILCTTEMHKIPATIISRSQVFEFKLASLQEIVAKIDIILKGEGREIDKEGKEFIAKIGKGSFRDTESILEKVLKSEKSKSLKFDDVISILGFSELVVVTEFKELLYLKDLKSIQSLLQDKLEEGNVSNFNYQVSEMIYEDIIIDLQNNKTDHYKIGLFEYLCGIDKEVKGSLSPKMLYIAKVLSFVSKNSLPIQNARLKGFKSKDKESDIQDEITKRSNSNAEVFVKDEEENSTTKTLKISKIDFLEYIKSRNTFLYKIFMQNDFRIDNGQVVVHVNTKMDEDILKKFLTHKIITDFANKIGQPLKLVIDERKKHIRENEEKKTIKVSKKVQDLSDDEIKEIFHIK